MYDYLRKLANLLVEKNNVEIEIGTYKDYQCFLNMEDNIENQKASSITMELRELIFETLRIRNYYDEIIILHDKDIESGALKKHYEECGEKAIIIKCGPASIVVKNILRNIKIRSNSKCLLCNKETELENGRCSSCR